MQKDIYQYHQIHNALAELRCSSVKTVLGYGSKRIQEIKIVKRIEKLKLNKK